jgi:hypothetical protein
VATLDQPAQLLLLAVLERQPVALEEPGPQLVDPEGRQMREIRLAEFERVARLDVLVVMAALFGKVDRLPLSGTNAKSIE